jgi:hypothetical protein
MIFFEKNDKIYDSHTSKMNKSLSSMYNGYNNGYKIQVSMEFAICHL